jgi:hypothetical protein
MRSFLSLNICGHYKVGESQNKPVGEYHMDKSMEDAFRFISQELKANPGANRAKLIEEACQKFDLDPKKAEFLISKFIMDK